MIPRNTNWHAEFIHNLELKSRAHAVARRNEYRRQRSWSRNLRKRLATLLAAGAITVGGSLDWNASARAELPTGADVVAGAAIINSGGPVMDVNATSTRTIINWNQFSIGSGNTANFNLPDSSSAILNRVTTPDMPSVINGALNSNGNVMLVNPSGIMVGASGLVNTNAFTASTFDIANDKFMAGGALTFSGDSAAGLVNNGTINTGTGGAHLIANDISNNGSITSSGGNITLSGGGEVTLNNGVTYVQPTLETLSSGISPTAGLIQNTGTIRATGAATSGGEVYLVNPNGKILHDGTIAAHREPTRLAAAPGETSAASGGGSYGGCVQLEADEITLSENSSIDVAGTDGGGTVLVGGDWQGSGNMTQATSVTMEAGATIDASATERGDGGTIVLWSDVANAGSITKAFGTLVARAGELFGDGGQIETSGARIETDGVSVDAGAANGNGGHWLIDPYNYLIDAVAASNIVSALNTGTSVTVTTTADNASYGSSGTNTDLGDIVVDSDIVTGAMSGDATLTLQAHRHINVDANIDATQNGNTARLNVTLLADSDHSGDGINIVNGDSIKTNGGNLAFGDGSTATIGGSSVQVGGDVYISGTAAQLLETGGGTITVNGETILANTTGVRFDSGDGAIVFGGVLDSGNQYTYVDGPDGQANSWDWARNDARNGTAGGAALGDSYMVTITSRLENAIAGIAAEYRGAWIGAHRPVPGASYDWQWADGPEAGQTFFVQSGSGSSGGGSNATAGNYSNFGNGEPNGSLGAGGESVGQFFGNQGLWNDLGAGTTFAATQESQYSVLGYVRETNLAPTAVTINAGSGSVTFNGGIGGSKTLASLDVTASQGIFINGGQVNTTGTQTFRSPVLLGNHTHLSTIQSDIVFDSTVDSNSTSTPWNLTTTITPGNVYHWVDWTTWDAASKTATGTIMVGSDVITVTYHNPQGIYGIQTSGGTAYWTGRGGGAFAGESPYVSDNVANGPSTTDLIQLRYAGSQTLTFSESVENLAFSIMSMNGNGYGFDQDFTIESYSGLNGAGPGYFGGGTMTKAIVGDTFQLNDGGINSASDGHSEPHGTIRFGNAFSELTWNSLSDETWNAFSVGVSGTSSTAGSVQFNGAVGSNAALGDITVNAAVQTTANIAAASSFDVTGLANLGGDITTSGDQTFGSAVTLGTDTALTTTSNGNVNFVSTVDGDHDLSVETSGTGDVTLSAAIGANEALSGLTITTDGVGADVTFKSSIVVEGDVSIGGGDVLISGDVTKSTAANTTVSLLASGSLTVDSGVTIGTATDTTDLAVASGTSGNFDGLLIGDGSLTKSGNGFLRINTVQTYTGDTTINDGILMLGADDVLPDLTRLIVNANGILSLNSFDDTVGSIEGSGLIENGSIVRDGIVLWLDAGNGASYDGTGTTWNDLGGNGYDGTLFGDPTYNGSKRQFEFTTNAQYAQLGALPADFLSSGDGVLDGLTLFTVADFGTANLWERIVDFGSGDPTDNIILSRFGNTDAVNFELYPGSGGEEHKVDLTGTNTLITAGGGTRSYAGTADGTNFRLFADGNLEITTAETALPNEVELSNNYIGKSNWSADDTLRGSIGIVLVYDRALSSSEVQQNHSALIARSPATLTVGGNNLDTTFSGQLENGADTLNLTKIGTGALTLSGNNGYSGTTTINAGSLIVGAGGTSGTLGTGNVINNTDLLFKRSDDFTIVNDISGTGDLTKQGTNELTLTGDATYSGETDVSDGSLVFQNDVAPAISGFTGNGSVTIEPTGTSFSGAVTSNYGIADTIIGLTIGKDGNTSDVTVDSLTNIDGDVSLHGGNVTINNTLTTTAGNKLTIDASGDVTQTSAITTDSLALQGTGNFTIGNAGNSIGTLAGGESGTLLGNITILNPSALTVGTVGTQNGILASGTVNLATRSGDLTIAQDIATTNTSASAIMLNAGQTTAAGTATGGNLVLSNSPSITVGTGGRATLYTGSVADSMGLAELLNSGSGRFRYNSDESATNFSLALGSGVYGVYRERPTVSGAVGNQTVTYGTAPTLTPTITGTVNGDTTAQVFGAAPTIDVGGSTSTSGNYTVGDHSLTISAGAEQLGYAFNTFTGGTLTVNAKSITTSIAINGKVYDGTNAATITAGANGTILGDAVTVNGSAAFDNADAGTGKTVTVTGINLTGADASNYVLNSTSHSGTADITQKQVSISGLEVANRSYDGSAVATVDHSGVIFSGKVSGDELTAASTSGVFDNKNIGTGKTVTLNGTVYGGSDVDNYSFVDQTTTTANIVAKEVTVSGIAVGDKVYDGNTTATVDFSGVAFDGIVSGDELTASGTTATFGNKNVGTDKTVALAGTTYGGTNSGNYSFTNQATAVANISRLDSVMWIGGAAGDWSDPANWAGGAIPDLANVAHVIIPNGVTPTFNSSVAGPVDIDSLTGGNFQIDSGTLNVAQDAALDEYTQNGGAFNVGGNMSATDFAQNGSSLGITGRLDVTNSFTQSPTGTIDVTGDVEINQSIGDLQVENLSGHNVNLNSPKGGVRLGHIGAAGTLAVTAGDGNVEQLPGKRIKVTGTSTFNATGDITLTNSDNDFVGPVNANGNNVAITDGHGGLILNDITTVGTFDATSTGGPINQDASGTMTINGAATFSATDGSSPADILLGGINNDFRGVVNASGGHIGIVDAGGGVLLGIVDARGQFGVLSNGGPITQTPGGSVRVYGESFFTAQANGQPKKIILNNKSNHFGGKVNIDADTFELDDEDGKVALGRVRSSRMDSVLNQATSALARDTNTRYTTETNSGTGILNVVQRYGQKWMSQLAERLFGDRNNSVPAITEESVQKVDTDVFLNVANNTDEGTRGRN